MGRFDSITPDGAQAEPLQRDEEDRYDADYFLGQADAALAQGRFEGALKLYGRALERDRQRAAAWLGQVRALMDLGHPEEAQTWLEQAAAILGEIPPLLAMRAIASARCGDLEDALAWSDRAMREGEDHAVVWLSRGEVLYLSGQVPVARRALDKAVERTPGALTERRAGEVALDYGDLGQAAIWLERAWRHAPEDALVALRLGVLRERQGDLKRARAELERALALEPQLTGARLALKSLDERSWWDGVKHSLGRLFHGQS